MKNNKITKIGLLNYWLFDEEEFQFFDGKLLLRGENGSGKSVTMQSFIPLILDGNKSPSRLDPFGTKEKRIEDYVLGPSDGVQKDDATSYLYMETYNEELDKFITVGIGLHSRKGRGTDFFGFSLKDGRRINEDFFLYKDHVQKVPLTKNELKARLGTANDFVDTTKDYKCMVNDLLFGFKEIDAYDEFISVLLQLRSPKLSKEYSPTKLMEILKSVLQPLTEDDLRPLSEAIEDANKTKEKIEKLESQVKSLNNFTKTYQNYNEILLYNKASAVADVGRRLKSTNQDIQNKKTTLESINKRLEDIKVHFQELENEFNEMTTKKETIDNNDLKKHTEELEHIKESIAETNIQAASVKDKLEKLLQKEQDNTKSLEKLETQIYDQEKDITVLCDNITDYANEVKLPDIAVAISELTSNYQSSVNFSYLSDRLQKYKTKITEIKDKLEEKEGLERNLSQKQEEYNKLKQEYTVKEESLRKETSLLKDAIDRFKDTINLLNKNNELVHIDDEDRLKIFNYIDNYNHQNYINAMTLYQQIAHAKRSQIEEEKFHISNDLQIAKDKLKQLNEELEDLKANKEITPQTEEELQDTKKYLDEQGITYVPLYQAITFKDKISDEVKNHLEELLLSMNILNAFIVSNKDIAKVHHLKGIFLKATSPKKNNLTKYFQVESSCPISDKDVTAILESISVEQDSNIHITNDNYQFDFIIGYPGHTYQSKYIGLLRRIEEQKQKILLKEEEIDEQNKVTKQLEDILNDIKQKLVKITDETKGFPKDDDLEQIQTNIDKLTVELSVMDNTDKELTIAISNLNTQIESLMQTIKKLKENITIPLNLPSYLEALMQIDLLIGEVYELKNSYNNLQNMFDKQLSFNQIKEDITSNIEYQNSELTIQNNTLNKLLSKKKAIDDILSNPKYQDIIKELKIITERLTKIPNEQNELSKEEGKLESSRESLIQEIALSEEQLSKDNTHLELTELILRKEYDLGYVYKDVPLDVNTILHDLKERKNSDVVKGLTNYLNAFNEYRGDLLEYRLNTKEIFPINEAIINKYQDNGLTSEEIINILKEGTRQDMTAVYQGKTITVYELISYLEDAIAESKNYISVQERHLFEDILLKTVGNKIRDRIESSKKWVSKMNEIMRNTQIDSNLSFQLDWKSIQAYTEDELDTKELVRLFQIDPGLIAPGDSDKLINHFRSKINKELEYNENAHVSYTEVIGRVLDYRNWFEFKLYYKRKVGEKKELTNKIFSIFSGGERAKSMYVPLFAATYAKLLSASPKALRIIALDEAFAGVDETNIREMFSILSQLDLDYILTSQALWGDYDTVKSLSICELIKDETLESVGVRHYKWNGKVKEILDKFE